MHNLKDVIEEARDDAQQLQAELQAASAKHYAVIRAEVLDVSAEADELSRRLRCALAGEQGDVKLHLQAAASLCEQIAREAQELPGADDAQLKSYYVAAAQKAHAAVVQLVAALAKKRAALSLP